MTIAETLNTNGMTGEEIDILSDMVYLMVVRMESQNVECAVRNARSIFARFGNVGLVGDYKTFFCMTSADDVLKYAIERFEFMHVDWGMNAPGIDECDGFYGIIDEILNPMDALNMFLNEDEIPEYKGFAKELISLHQKYA